MGTKWIILFLLIIPCVSANSVRINEVMADPDQCDDAYCEWIELYNDGDSAINLSGWVIGDEYENDTIEENFDYGDGSTIISPGGYAIITDHGTEVYENFNVSMESTKLYVEGKNIGNGLKNTGETLYLYDKNEILIDSFTYFSTYAGLSCALFNETIWCKSEPTPGYFNKGSFIDFFTGACDWYIDLILDKTIFEKDEFEFRVDVKKNGGEKVNITLLREIQDVYGNLVSDYNPLTKELTYGSNFGGPWTPNYKPGMYYIKTCIETDCNEIRLDNNCDSGLFVIKDDEPSNNSNVKIDRIYDLGNDNIARFGQIIKVKLLIYKGDTNKEAITLHIEDINGQRVSKESKINVEDKFRDYTATIPIQLIPNCENRFSDGEYFIIVEGLGDIDKENIEISGTSPDLCEVIKEYRETDKTNVCASESVLNEEFITGNVVYEDKNEKQGKYAVYFFCFSLVMLIMYLILRKNEQENNF